MEILHRSLPLAQVEADWLIVPVFEEAESAPPSADAKAPLGIQLARLREAGDVTGKAGELTELRDLSDARIRRTLLVGLGKRVNMRPATLEKALMTAVRRVSTKRVESAAVFLSESLNANDGEFSLEHAVRLAAVAFRVGCVGQGLYKSEPDRFEPENGIIVTSAAADDAVLQNSIREGQILGESINLTRELINRAPDDLYPEVFAERAKSVAAEYGLQCDVFDEKRLEQERMRSLLAVAKGSDRAPRMVVVSHCGGAKNGPTLALVGKGVTFDSGGLSLKPSDGMKTMKCDMSGAATVLGALVAAARLKLPVNLVGLMGLVENMPGARAYKLGDILTARNGVTIEVQNTDAEGRLVLADVLAYAVDQKVSKIIDLATLTGSCVVALGEDIAGGFTNNQPWCDEVLAASRRAGEDIWQMPMFDAFNEQLKCDVADVKNIGTRWGGSITAAKFLERFVGETPWLHLDIAGPAFAESNKPHREGGATGAYVRTLIEAARRFESSSAG